MGNTPRDREGVAGVSHDTNVLCLDSFFPNDLDTVKVLSMPVFFNGTGVAARQMRTERRMLRGFYTDMDLRR